MPARKRQREPSVTDHNPNSKRTDSAPEESSKKSSAPESVEDQKIKSLLRECSWWQRNFIADTERVLSVWEDRHGRLRPYIDLQLKKNEDRLQVKKSVSEQIKKYKKELSGLKIQEVLVSLNVKEMKDQEEKLEMVHREVSKFKKCSVQPSDDIEIIELRPYEPYKEELEAALQKIPTFASYESEINNLPKLKKGDLDRILWPEKIVDLSSFSIHWEKDFEEAAECRLLDEKLKNCEQSEQQALSEYKLVRTRQVMIELTDKHRNKKNKDPKRPYSGNQLEQLIRKVFGKKAMLEKLKTEENELESRRKQREDLVKKIQEEMNSIFLNCPVCLESLTRGEQSTRCPKLFGSCGHMACAACMEKINTGTTYNCPDCRISSEKTPTNWALMQMIKETPAQASQEAPHPLGRHGQEVITLD